MASIKQSDHGWHQMLRHPPQPLNLSGHAKRLAELLGLTSGSNTSFFYRLYPIFFPSGLTHNAALHRRDSRAPHLPTGCSLLFFVLQAVAITTEDLVIAFGKKTGVKSGWAVTTLGYAWTWAWFAFSLPIMQDPIISAGLMDLGQPDSVVFELWRALNVHPNSLTLFMYILAYLFGGNPEVSTQRAIRNV
ncbi:hypothetical protein B0H10DRAFT_1955907 [Mycena sp. CBHHK59/15]|nr:hypothetical protein B0H10DRAFT_1955907 [Mycena sp. CBHHK59/15]